jgi:hypothetical protein
MKNIIPMLFILFAANLYAQEEVLEKVNSFWEAIPDEKVYLHTDRSLYELGEDIWFKAYVLDAKLLANSPSQILRVELLAPNGQLVREHRLAIWEGSAHGDFHLAHNGIGGIYKLRAYSLWQKNMPEALVYEKELTVKKQLLPNILMTLDFQRESYGAGSKVVAELELRSKANEHLALHNFDYELRLAGKAVFRRSMKTALDGRAKVEFELSKDLNTADAILTVFAEDQGNRESISRAVPILTQKIDLQFLPEGGQALLGLKQRIAFKALDEFGKPADIQGQIYNSQNQAVADFESYHQGMGSLEFQYQKGERYYAKIEAPIALETQYPLPAPIPVGLSLRVATEKDSLALSVYSSEDQEVFLVLQMRDSIYLKQSLKALEGANVLKLATTHLPIGVAQLTIFDEKGRPWAERLCFVNKDRQLKVELNTDREDYQIRDSVWLDIYLKDHEGHPVEADLSLAVVDDKNWTLADDKQDNILSNLLLSSDLKGDIYEPSFYFNPEKPKADTALDYVMLTHGYRRFDWQRLLEEAKWEIKYPAEPNNAIEGRITQLDQALANHKIKITTIGKDSMGQFPLFVESDENGDFIIPKLPTQLPVQLHTQIAGRWSRSAILRNHLHDPQKITNPKRGKGVMFRDQVNHHNTNYKDYYYQYKRKGDNQIYAYQNQDLDGNASIFGQVFDENGEPMAFAIIALYEDDALVRGTSTDFDGYYYFNGRATGTYDIVVSFVGYPKYKIEGVMIESGQSYQINIQYSEEFVASLDETIMVECVIVESSIDIMVDQSVAYLTSADIQNLGVRSVTTMVTPVSGIKQEDEGASLALTKSRPDGKKKRINKRQLKKELQQKRRAERQAARKEAAERRNTEAVAIKPQTENSILNEMQKMKGELPYNSKVTGRNSSISPSRVEAPDALAKFEVKMPVHQRLSRAKTFYAPNYGRYHELRKKQPNVTARRQDFRKTIYWQPYVQTDSLGHARILFFNSDAVTTQRIVVEGIAKHGQPIHMEKSYSVQTPFELDAKIPKILSKQDSFILPLVLRNNTEDSIWGKLKVNHPIELLGQLPDSILILPNSFVEKAFSFYVPEKSPREIKSFQLSFEAEGFRDEIRQNFEIKEKLFPMDLGFSSNALSFEKEFQIDSLIPGTLDGTFEIYLDPLNSFLRALEGMIQSPSGCFEQVSSTNYPNILALQLMKEMKTLRPDINNKALNYMDDAYQRLAAYECSSGGWEWYGDDPAHEVLTAYGLMEFKDMAEVYHKVDPIMIQRAKKWLMSRKNQKGGWKIEDEHYGWGHAQAVSDAYILHALAYSGEKDLEQECKKVSQEAAESGDLYRLGLAVLANFELGNKRQAEALFAQMQERLDKTDLQNIQADHTVTYAGNKALAVQVLSFAILASFKASKSKQTEVKRYYNALMKLRQRGYFGNTQSSVWALKAILSYSQEYPILQRKKGHLSLWVNGKSVQQFLLSDEILVNPRLDLKPYLQAGTNHIKVTVTGLEAAPTYALNANWRVQQPPSSAKASLSMRSSLKQSKLQRAETVRFELELKNLSEKGAPTPIAVVGIPAGLDLQLWQLKAMKERGEFDYYELKDNFLVLYFRGLKPHESRQLNFDLKAELPGVYQAPASSCYLYYEPENKHWVAGEKVSIQ